MRHSLKSVVEGVAFLGEVYGEILKKKYKGKKLKIIAQIALDFKSSILSYHPIDMMMEKERKKIMPNDTITKDLLDQFVIETGA